MEKSIMIAIIAVIIIAIIYVLFKQNFTVYTSGATQRFASQFSSTNQMDKNTGTENFKMPLNL